MKNLLLLSIIALATSCAKPIALRADYDRHTNFPNVREVVKNIPEKSKTWVFIMAGQSNMAGRGYISPKDTLSTERILSINSEGELIYAKEPFHWYEPPRTGLDCGLSFAQNILKSAPDDVTVLMIPIAIGGSSISQWVGDLSHHDVPLFTNFKEKAALAQHYGEVKAIIWHQGESDANPKGIAVHQERMTKLFGDFRYVLGNDQLPIITAELASFSETPENWQQINNAIHDYARSDANTTVINTQDFKHKGDNVHFNAKGLREMGKRFAKRYFEMVGE